ncbi:hypothetical protein KAYACHO_92 [Mycobacterium phage KayaCho]|uniref:hypothetical protein n=1 Tax=Mycobacterium phage KayaCho TaxID=1340830 RepID=UPI000387E769|nr:hypothetical protein N846_gp92 [Mycobacterium phage KayaCho]AGT12996.1 hypothetical protein KAYACHO_92 [Mycobacterium phage KayaCho]
MKWTRPEPGEYTAGPYKITRWMSAKGSGTPWFVDGPGVEIGWHATKDDAQAEAEDAALNRLGDDETAVVPIVGDVAEYAGLRCRISAVMATNDGQPLYCLVKPRGKRQCLLRSEFKVVMP